MRKSDTERNAIATEQEEKDCDVFQLITVILLESALIGVTIYFMVILVRVL